MKFGKVIEGFGDNKPIKDNRVYVIVYNIFNISTVLVFFLNQEKVTDFPLHILPYIFLFSLLSNPRIYKV